MKIKSKFLIVSSSLVLFCPFTIISCSKNNTNEFENPQVDFSFEIVKPNETIYPDQPYLFSIKVVSNNNLSTDDFYYKWNISNNYSLSNLTGKQAMITFNKVALEQVSLTVYKDSSMKQIIKEVFTIVEIIEKEEKPNSSNLIPTNEQLLIEGKTLKYCSWVPIKKSEVFLKEQTNNYGVLNTLSLIVKIYSNSNIMNSNNFENLNVLLLENNNYDYFKFQINSIANQDINNFGRFPFSSLSEAWQGANIKKNDDVKIVFEFQRNNDSSSKGKNVFDSSKLFFGNNLSSLSTINWNQLNVDLDLPYMTDFLGKCSIYVNNNLIRSSLQWENRVHFAMIYNHKNEYDPNNQDINVLCDIKAKL